jgi:hypothetical protein
MPVQGSKKYLIGVLCQLRLTENHNIKTTQNMLMMTKALAYNSLDAIAIHRKFRCLSGNGKTKARKSQGVVSDKNRKVWVTSL